MTDKIAELEKIGNMLHNLINGLDLNNTPIVDIQAYLATPEVMKQLSDLMEILNRQTQYERRQLKKQLQPFSITVEELAKVKLPEYPIGINEFAEHINKVIDTSKMKSISGNQINIKLKEKGILGEKVGAEGRRVTITNYKSKDYGIEMIDKEFQGKKYQKVIFTDKGKAFLLGHFLELMGLDEVSTTVE